MNQQQQQPYTDNFHAPVYVKEEKSENYQQQQQQQLFYLNPSSNESRKNYETFNAQMTSSTLMQSPSNFTNNLAQHNDNNNFFRSSLLADGKSSNVNEEPNSNDWILDMLNNEKNDNIPNFNNNNNNDDSKIEK